MLRSWLIFGGGILLGVFIGIVFMCLAIVAGQE